MLGRSVATAAAHRLLAVSVAAGVADLIFLCTIDVPMYFARWRADELAGRRYLTIAEGFHDSAVRWVVTHQWRDWREEIPWMTIYFSVGVWMSLALANVRPSRASRPSDKESQARAKA